MNVKLMTFTINHPPGLRCHAGRPSFSAIFSTKGLTRMMLHHTVRPLKLLC